MAYCPHKGGGSVTPSILSMWFVNSPLVCSQGVLLRCKLRYSIGHAQRHLSEKYSTPNRPNTILIRLPPSRGRCVLSARILHRLGGEKEDELASPSTACLCHLRRKILSDNKFYPVHRFYIGDFSLGVLCLKHIKVFISEKLTFSLRPGEFLCYCELYFKLLLGSKQWFRN